MLIKTTSTCRLQTVLLLVLCLVLPVSAIVVQTSTGELSGTTAVHSSMDPDGAV